MALSAAAALLTGGGMSFYTFLSQKERLLFNSEPILKSSPKQLGIPYENISIFFAPSESYQTVLRGWWIPASSRKNTEYEHVILYCHGSVGNISDHLDFVRFVSIYLPNCSVFMYDYLGYGDSGGDVRPTLDMCHASTLQAFKWLVYNKEIPRSKIIVWGEELGGIFATWLVHSLKLFDIAGLILQGSPKSIYDFASEKLKRYYITWPVAIAYEKHVDVVDCVKSMVKDHIPILAIHAIEDTQVPLASGKYIGRYTTEFVTLTGKKSPLFTNANTVCESIQRVFFDHGDACINE